MLPWFAIMGFLLYQRYLHPSDDSLLIYALGCLLLGVIFGGLIVGASGAADSEEESTDAKDSTEEIASAVSSEALFSSSAAQDNAVKLEPTSLKTATDQSSAISNPNDLFDNATPLSLDTPLTEMESNEALARELLSPISEKPTSYGPAATDTFAPGLQFTTAAEEELVVKLVSIAESEQNASSDAAAIASSTSHTESSSTEAIAESKVEAKKDEIEANANADADAKGKTETVATEAVVATPMSSENLLAAEQNVDRAQLVVARLEAEVAKAEAVAAKLEVELAKAEPMAARLQSAEKAIKDAHMQARLEEELALNFKSDNKSQTPKDQSSTQPGKAQQQAQSGKGTPQQNKPQKTAKVKTSETRLPDLKTVEAWLNHAEKMLAEDNFDAAIRCYDQATKIEIKNFDAWYLKAVALKRKSAFEDALYCINYALGIKNQSSDALAEKGECLLELGKAEQALVWFEKSLSFDKVAPKPWLGKGRCLASMNRHKDAVACFDKVLAMQPDNAKAKEAKKISAAKIGVKN